MVTSLFQHHRIETTEAKAKELRVISDQMISLGKDGTLSARRLALAYIMDKNVVARLFADLAPLFSRIQGGYTRLIKTRNRYGDGAPMAVVELTRTPTTADAAPAAV